ncbi:SoxR reducing system RseC family protein [Pseudothermotoga sp.]|uniref:SoxR reducing system RseC family protein n=1 Tax=Pseudothermotoga sp. TaxID=2033661 RepID=UPI0031F600B8
MARETMVVRKILNDKIVLERDRTSMCGKCPANMFCTGETQKMRLIVERTDLELNEGDVVLVETPAVSATKMAFIVYTIPTILFIVTTTLTVRRFEELTAFFLGLLSVAVYFSALKIYDKRFRKKFKPKVLGIIETAERVSPSDGASLPK